MAAARADGRFLYVGTGSNSNITERGMLAEAGRAMGVADRCSNERLQALREGRPAIAASTPSVYGPGR